MDPVRLPSARTAFLAGIVAALALASALILTRGPPRGADPGSGGFGGNAPSAEGGREPRKAAGDCAFLPSREKSDCYTALLADRVAARGIGAAMALLDSLSKGDPDAEREGHAFAHHVGIEGYRALRRAGGTAGRRGVARAFAECSEQFASGCFHGVVQAHFAAGDAADDRALPDRAALDATCAELRDGEEPFLSQCLHGLGHGLVIHLRYDLPRALEACDRLSRGWDRQECYVGAFMENVIRGTASAHPGHRPAERPPPEEGFPALRPDDLHHPCSALEERHLPACYLMQTSGMLHLTGGDVGAVAAACEEAPFLMRPVCFHSLGRDITALAAQDPVDVRRLCDRTPELHRRACYEGAAQSLVRWRAEPSTAVALCSSLEEEAEARRCYRGMGRGVASSAPDPAERERLCATVEPAHVETCREGARLPVRTTDVRDRRR